MHGLFPLQSLCWSRGFVKLQIYLTYTPIYKLMEAHWCDKDIHKLNKVLTNACVTST